MLFSSTQIKTENIWCDQVKMASESEEHINYHQVK